MPDSWLTFFYISFYFLTYFFLLKLRYNNFSSSSSQPNMLSVPSYQLQQTSTPLPAAAVVAPASAVHVASTGKWIFFLSLVVLQRRHVCPGPAAPRLASAQRYPTNETTWKSVKMCRKPYGRGRAHAGTGIKKRKRRSRRRARGSRFARARARSGQYYCSLSGRGQKTSVCPGLGWAGRTALHAARVLAPPRHGAPHVIRKQADIYGP